MFVHYPINLISFDKELEALSDGNGNYNAEDLAKSLFTRLLEVAPEITFPFEFSPAENHIRESQQIPQFDWLDEDYSDAVSKLYEQYSAKVMDPSYPLNAFHFLTQELKKAASVNDLIDLAIRSCSLYLTRFNWKRTEPASNNATTRFNDKLLDTLFDESTFSQSVSEFLKIQFFYGLTLSRHSTLSKTIRNGDIDLILCPNLKTEKINKIKAHKMKKFVDPVYKKALDLFRQEKSRVKKECGFSAICSAYFLGDGENGIGSLLDFIFARGLISSDIHGNPYVTGSRISKNPQKFLNQFIFHKSLDYADFPDYLKNAVSYGIERITNCNLINKLSTITEEGYERDLSYLYPEIQEKAFPLYTKELAVLADYPLVVKRLEIIDAFIQGEEYVKARILHEVIHQCYFYFPLVSFVFSLFLFIQKHVNGFELGIDDVLNMNKLELFNFAPAEIKPSVSFPNQLSSPLYEKAQTDVYRWHEFSTLLLHPYNQFFDSIPSISSFGMSYDYYYKTVLTFVLADKRRPFDFRIMGWLPPEDAYEQPSRKIDRKLSALHATLPCFF